jgi:hypothetical protein
MQKTPENAGGGRVHIFCSVGHGPVPHQPTICTINNLLLLFKQGQNIQLYPDNPLKLFPVDA